MYTGASDCKTEFKKQNKKMTFPLLHHSSMMFLLPQISIKPSSNIFFLTLHSPTKQHLHLYTHVLVYVSITEGTWMNINFTIYLEILIKFPG